MTIRHAILTALLLFVPLALASQGSSNLSSEFDELYDKATTLAADRPVPQVFFQIAQDRASVGDSKFNDIGQLANYLADDFSLYSKVHGELIRDHCENKESDIAPYLAALANESAPDAAVARKIYARLKVNYDDIWFQLKPQAAQGVEGIIENFAGTLGVPSAKLCTKLASDPKGAARKLGYPTARASRSQILRAISP